MIKTHDNLMVFEVPLLSISGGILNEKYVLSSRVRCGRNIRNYSLPPHCTKRERKDVEHIVSSALENLEGMKVEISEFNHSKNTLNRVLMSL